MLPAPLRTGTPNACLAGPLLACPLPTFPQAGKKAAEFLSLRFVPGELSSSTGPTRRWAEATRQSQRRGCAKKAQAKQTQGESAESFLPRLTPQSHGLILLPHQHHRGYGGLPYIPCPPLEKVGRSLTPTPSLGKIKNYRSMRKRCMGPGGLRRPLLAGHRTSPLLLTVRLRSRLSKDSSPCLQPRKHSIAPPQSTGRQVGVAPRRPGQERQHVAHWAEEGWRFAAPRGTKPRCCLEHPWPEPTPSSAWNGKPHREGKVVRGPVNL